MRITRRRAKWKISNKIADIFDRVQLLPVITKERGPFRALKFAVNPDKYSLPVDLGYSMWMRRFGSLDHRWRKENQLEIQSLTIKPKISIVIALENISVDYLDAIRSVQDQLYPHWQLYIVGSDWNRNSAFAGLQPLAKADPRIRMITHSSDNNFVSPLNEGLRAAAGDYVLFMKGNDRLAANALFEVAKVLNRTDADVIFSDEDRIDENGRRHSPYFKPDYNYDQLLGQNFMEGLCIFRLVLAGELKFREGKNGSAHYDLLLRIAKRSDPSKIIHIKKIIFHRGAINEDFPEECQSETRNSRRVVQEHLLEVENGGADIPTVIENPLAPPFRRIIWPVPQPKPSISVIIPTRNRADLLDRCIKGVLHQTDYEELEIIIVDNESNEQSAKNLISELQKDRRVKILNCPGAFNFSKLNNDAARIAAGQHLLLLNNDIEVIEPDWLNEMVRQISRPKVGIVGAKLIYGDWRIQHAGVRVGQSGKRIQMQHLGRFHARKDPGYFASYALVRQVSAVTAACLLIQRRIFEEVGGLDASNLPIAFNDVDLCLKVNRAGYKVLFTPFAELFHLESASRGHEDSPEKQARFAREREYMNESWKEAWETDPFYNENFEYRAADFRLRMR